jgi:hypothetical protein
MRRILLAAALSFALLPARAVALTCPSAGGTLNLPIPRVGDMGSGWANCIYQAIVQLSAGSFPSASIPKVYVSTIGAVDASGILFSSGPVSMTGAGGLSITNGVTAATGVFTGTGDAVYSLSLSSGVTMSATGNPGITAPWFSGAHYGNGAALTGIPESGVTNLTTDFAAKASTGLNNDITSINALGVSKSSPVFTGSLGLGGSPSGTRKFQVYFNANNNSPSYGDGAVRYLDSVNGVGFECGALYGGSQPSWCQSGNDGMGTKKPFVFQPDGSNVGIRTLSPATTAALEVAGPVSVGGSGNTQYSLQASSGASFGSDIHVTGTLEATKLKGDGSQLTGIGGGGTVTTQGSPAAGQVAVFQAGTVLSSSPISVAYGAGGAATTTVSGSLAHPFGSAVSYANGAVTVYGDATTGNMLNSSGVAVWAKSIDGITQSSGCLVAMQFANTNAKGAWFSASADTATLVFTSTTTTLTNVGVAIMPGVLLDTCAPLSICHVGIKGMFRVQTTGASSQYPDFTTTRCAAGADNAFDASAVGGYMNASPAAGMTWIQLR